MSDETSEPNSQDELEELPPVEPPSAKFIVQLFVIPAIIVIGIVGVYTLFGRLAAGEQDWRELVTELRSANEHRRWRAALGLAQMLRNDLATDSDSELSNNPEIGKALVDLFEEQLAAGKTDPVIKQQVYLATTLAYLNQPRRVIPPLQQAALTEDYDRETRKAAAQSLAVLSGRSSEVPELRTELLAVPDVVEGMIDLTHDEDALFRQTGAFILGLIPEKSTRDRLEVLLNDGDSEVRANAAIALARQQVTAGWPVFRDVLTQTANKTEPESVERQQVNLVVLKNTLKAVGDLAGKWSDAETEQLIEWIQPIADSHPESRIRTDADLALQALRD
ncbi:HEAT repeat domain-containing protein [Thalassoroseus pseudoceratinae]|uniref:HEAT repeat domain-containing protein n=1 Tax=Thalassoroseus pseudoceratinae TaxID=2713176 RepID=UPI00141E6161|nr:HEAT repeat domain-containing protein [Thalassoroseus pseudoceratinae]